MENQKRKHRPHRTKNTPYICPQCQEIFFIQYQRKYPYKIEGTNDVFFCSYNCMNAYKKFERKKKVLNL